jgi:hypothetical protein
MQGYRCMMMHDVKLTQKRKRANNYLIGIFFRVVTSSPFRIDVLHSIPNVHGIPMCSGLLVCPEPAFLVPTLGHQHIQKCIYKILSIDYY